MALPPIPEAVAVVDVRQEAQKARFAYSSRSVIKRNLNPAKCSDIITSMHRNYYELEVIYAAKPYLDKQSDINAKMRAILVDWLVEVHYKFELRQRTLWLTINI